MLKGLQGRTVLVTGAGGGIGAEACKRFLAEGCNVIAADISSSILPELQGERLVTVQCDVSKAADAFAAVAAADRFGGLDMAMLNAGVECRAASVADFDEAEYQRVFNVNVLGSFLTAQATVKHLLVNQRRGSIVFTASIAALQGSPTTSIYNASKHAVLGLSRSLALEVAKNDIRVNTLCPGTVETRMIHALEESMGAAAGLSRDQMREAMHAANPVGRHGSPEEIASMAAWILSDEAPYAHGEIFTIGGGLMA